MLTVGLTDAPKLKEAEGETVTEAVMVAVPLVVPEVFMADMLMVGLTVADADMVVVMVISVVAAIEALIDRVTDTDGVGVVVEFAGPVVPHAAADRIMMRYWQISGSVIESVTGVMAAGSQATLIVVVRTVPLAQSWPPPYIKETPGHTPVPMPA